MKLEEEIKFIDFHSHHGLGDSETVVIRNLLALESIPVLLQPGTYYSIGIHPWYLTRGNSDELSVALRNTLGHQLVIALGEAGFDALRGPALSVQYDAFIFQARLAEELDKPMIIHSVRLWDVLRKTKEKINPRVKWVVHGFRGKAKLASDLVSDGFMLSLGLGGILPEVIEAAGLNNILLETDDSDNSIKNVYDNLAQQSGIGIDQVITQIRDNFNRCFSSKGV
jgi:TatD DNase family protein